MTKVILTHCPFLQLVPLPFMPLLLINICDTRSLGIAQILHWHHPHQNSSLSNTKTKSESWWALPKVGLDGNYSPNFSVGFLQAESMVGSRTCKRGCRTCCGFFCPLKWLHHHPVPKAYPVCSTYIFNLALVTSWQYSVYLLYDLWHGSPFSPVALQTTELQTPIFPMWVLWCKGSVH